MKIIPLFLASLLIITPFAASAEIKSSNIDEIIFIHYQDENVAIQEVKAGNIDAYFWRIPIELTPDLRNNPNIKIYETPGGKLSLLLNPAESDKFNPFSIREVRYAMNYLIDRELIVNEVLKGAGAPAYTAFGQFDPDYTVLVDIIESFGFTYNPTLANSIISNALESKGAVKIDGKWYYNNEPITIKFFIRNDDPRRNSIGKMIALELSKLGFTIEEINGDLTKAQEIVYGSDPKNLAWHIYTEGWGSSAFVKYDNSLAAQMYAPWFAFMPGFQQERYWNYQNATLDDLTIRIFNGNFTSKNERDQLLRDAIRLGVNESVRLFIASTLDPYIVNKNMNGVVTDFGAGITGRFTLINARSDDNILKIGMKQIYQGSWNPVAGLKDWYATRVWLAVADPAIFTHPHTGNLLPVRAEWKVESAGPNNKLDVPSDAFIWNATSEEWVTVGNGIKATSKVTFDLKYSKWHHGAMMDKNDILYAIYFLYEWGSKENENDQTFDPEYASSAQQLIKTLKGFKFIDDDTVEVYVDYWHFDENYIADYASVWSTTPWEIYAAMEEVVKNKKAAFSRTEASINNVGWLSLLIKEDSEMLKETLIKFRDENFIPKPLINNDVNANDRYNKAISWIDAKKHAVISNGPYYLDNYNPDARTITIKAFRDDTYPFDVGYWKEFENVRLVKIGNLNVPLTINRGESFTIDGRIDYDGNYNDISIFYFISNGNDVVVKGNTIPKPDKTFTINISILEAARLSEGSNKVKIMAISNQALMPDIRNTAIIGVGNPIQLQNLTIDGHDYSIGLSPKEYVSKITADTATNTISLTLNIDKDTNLKIVLPREIIDSREDGNDKPFVITVDGNIVEVKEESNEKERVLEIPLTANNKEIRITGTQIIPEFGIALLILTISISSLLLLRKSII